MHRRQFLTGTLGALTAVTLPGPALGRDVIKLRELYARDGSASSLAESLVGERITIDGFMAPPLQAESQFFVLTRIPMAVCPFCETEADWPKDILAVYTKRTVDVVPFNKRITSTGVLELGSYRDPNTGFLSMVRLNDAVYG